MAGYHIKEIERGVYGEPSKIREEAEEFIDAVNQQVSLMALVELSDLYGAMVGFLEKHHPELTMGDIQQMSEVTRRAFESGARG